MDWAGRDLGLIYCGLGGEGPEVGILWMGGPRGGYICVMLVKDLVL